MKEIVVISGKGGTGKTSVTAAFAALANQPVLLDCDVDAADLHLILAPTILERHTFNSGKEASIREADCTHCGACQPLCRFEAIVQQGEKFRADRNSCEGCGVCVHFCPSGAIDFSERTCGEWYVSNTRYGHMVHARLLPGSENSGKLVSVAREAARKIAFKQRANVILSDGPPGIGCPVIASITGASLVVIVTEPTLSGEHDMKRMLELTRQLRVPAAVIVNKWDLNKENTVRIETFAMAGGAKNAGRIKYDRVVTEAQKAGKTILEFENGSVADEIRKGWNSVWELLQKE